MSLIQPKPYLNRMRLRNHAIGNERRRNMSKIILENGTPFPKPVTYSDIDATFFEWVENKLDIVYNGKKLPTYKLFSNQKISEYSQTWSNLDDTGNIIMNFKTVTRENNPQHGESQGGNYNVPGHRDYPMFYVPVLQENGEEAYDLYSMKQPLSVNFLYTVSVICNKYDILNEFNETMHYEFSGLECYLSPNGHHMPMVIENITDESEYSIDDRKYYSQSYQIKLMGYVIREEDFKVTKVPSRFTIRMNAVEGKGKYKKVSINDCWLSELENAAAIDMEHESSVTDDTQLEKLQNQPPINACDSLIDLPAPHRPQYAQDDTSPRVCVPKYDGGGGTDPDEPDPYNPDPYNPEPDDDSHYIHKIIRLIAEFPYCQDHSTTFTMDVNMDIDTIETVNVKTFVIKVNGVEQTFEEETRFNIGDEIFIDVTRENEYDDSGLTIVGTDPDTVIDINADYETDDDRPATEEDIYVNKKEEDAEE